MSVSVSIVSIAIYVPLCVCVCVFTCMRYVCVHACVPQSHQGTELSEEE